MNKLLTMALTTALITACAAPVSNERNEKTVFVTKASFPSDMGGLAGADAKCQAEADDPESIVPSGTYMAWLSDGINSPDTRFTKSSHPYVLPDGTKIAEDYSDLTDGTIQHPLNIDATGAPIGFKEYWTGTYYDGTTLRANETCYAWGADLPGRAWGMMGRSIEKTRSWTSFISPRCRNTPTHPLACFQQ
jgi:hypothetical protein